MNFLYIEDFGLFVVGLDRKMFWKIMKDVFIDNFYNIVRVKGYDEKKMKEIVKLVK